MKNLATTIAFTITSTFAFAQEGYIKFSRNNMVKGIVRVHTQHKSGEHQLEFLESANDPQPKRYHKRDVMEYAIQKDTFKVLKNFTPFDVEDFKFELVDAKVLKSGKINLLGIDSRHATISSYSGGHDLQVLLDENLAHLPYVYVLHETGTDYYRGIPSKKNKFREYLIDFFDESVIEEYERKKGELHFRDLEKFVTYYNATTK